MTSILSTPVVRTPPPVMTEQERQDHLAAMRCYNDIRSRGAVVTVAALPPPLVAAEPVQMVSVRDPSNDVFGPLLIFPVFVVSTGRPYLLVSDIIAAVIRRTGVSRVQIRGQGRLAHVVWARHWCFYLIRTRTRRSLPEIGRLMGDFDHTTVLHGVRKIAGLLTRDFNVMAELRTYDIELTRIAARRA